MKITIFITQFQVSKNFKSALRFSYFIFTAMTGHGWPTLFLYPESPKWHVLKPSNVKCICVLKKLNLRMYQYMYMLTLFNLSSPTHKCVCVCIHQRVKSLDILEKVIMHTNILSVFPGVLLWTPLIINLFYYYWLLIVC